MIVTESGDRVSVLRCTRADILYLLIANETDVSLIARLDPNDAIALRDELDAFIRSALTDSDVALATLRRKLSS